MMCDTPFPGFAAVVVVVVVVVANLVLVATTGASTAPHRKLVQIHPTEVIPDCFVVEVVEHDDVAAVLDHYRDGLHVTAIYQRALHGFAACFDDLTLQQLLADVRIARIGQDGTLQEEEEEEDEEKDDNKSLWLDKKKGDDEDNDGEDVFVVQDSDSSTTIPKLTMQSPAPFHLDRIDGTVDDKYHYAWDGAGVTVYIVDSGIRASHTEFEHRLDVN